MGLALISNVVTLKLINGWRTANCGVRVGKRRPLAKYPKYFNEEAKGSELWNSRWQKNWL